MHEGKFRHLLCLLIAGTVFFARSPGCCQAKTGLPGHPLSRMPKLAQSNPADTDIKVPFTLLTCNTLKILSFATVTAFLISQADDRIYQDYAVNTTPFPYRQLKSYGELGRIYDHRYTWYYIGGLSAAAAGYSLITGDKRPLTTLRLMFNSLLITTIVTTVLKVTIGRHRPYLHHSSTSFELLKFKTNTDYLSFPSGHTASIFSLMTVLAKQSGNAWISAGAYLFAGSVGFQRMLDREHWASDVIAGGVIGYLVGSYVVRKQHSLNHDNIAFFPYIALNRFGISLNF